MKSIEYEVSCCAPLVLAKTSLAQEFLPAEEDFEVPKPRWSTIEAFRFGIPIPERAPEYRATRLHLTAPVHAVNQTENYL
jgi:hypothetical protein